METNNPKAYRDLAFLQFTISVLIFYALLNVGCAEKPKAAETALSCQSLQGHYFLTLNPANTLDIAGDCTFTDSYCGYTATYTIPTANPGTSTITILGTNGTPGCLSSTAHSCNVNWDSNSLVIDCNSSPAQYTRN